VINIALGNGKQCLTDRNRFFEIARCSTWECDSIHNILTSFEAIGPEPNRVGKSNLKRIVSMLTRLIQRSNSVSGESIEYEKKLEQSIGSKCSMAVRTPSMPIFYGAGNKTGPGLLRGRPISGDVLSAGPPNQRGRG